MKSRPCKGFTAFWRFHLIENRYSEISVISNKLTKAIEQEQLTFVSLTNLLNPTIPNDIIKSERESRDPIIFIRRNSKISIDPERVYIGLPLRLAHVLLWVDRRYRTNPLSHIPGGSDVVVEYHDGRALGYDWIKKPGAYIRTFFAGIIEYGSYEFYRLDEKTQIEITRNKIAKFYTRKYKNDEEYSTAVFEEVWNSETSKEMPWNALKRFASTPQQPYRFDFERVSDFNPTSLLDYYGYEPEYEDPIDKAERIYGIPDPRLVED